jgi:Mg2+-importing ATPase
MPQKWDIRGIQSFMLVFGAISTAFDLLTFAVLTWIFHAPETLFQSAWFVVSLLTELAVVLVLRTHLPSWQSRPSRLLVFSTLAVAVVAVALPYLAPVAVAFNFTPLPLPLLLSSLAIVVFYVLATEAAKPRFYARLMAVAPVTKQVG